MRDRIKQVMANVFETSMDAIPDDADQKSVSGWDSLGQVQLMLALEDEFGVRMPAEEMVGLVSLEMIEQYLREHGVSSRR
jgi:acyl carrier protein